MLPSVLPRLATDSAARVFPGVWKPFFLRSPSRDGAPSPPPLSPFSSFIFFPTCFWSQWSALLGAWCPLPACRSCFVEFTQRWNVLLMNLWGRKWSPILFLCHLRTASAFFTVQYSHPYMTTGKTIALTRWTFVGNVKSLLFNTQSRLVITFLPRSKHHLISWLQSPFAVILEHKKIKSDTFHCFPIYFPWSDETRCHDLRFLNVEL